MVLYFQRALARRADVGGAVYYAGAGLDGGGGTLEMQALEELIQTCEHY